MRRLYRNTLDLSITPDPQERRQNISKEIIRHADYLPRTLSYEDIDKSFKEWVEDKIEIIHEGKKLPTMVLYSNQRFSEYMQTWQYTDENNNVRLNFKTVTRETNPNHGTILGDTYNIPGNRYYTLKTIDALDEYGNKYYVKYKMKQPTAVDFKYKVSILTNHYVTINEFNEIVNRLFNAKQSYICPNGHYMPIILDSFNDESEYNISDRQFFSQSVSVTLKGYIIKEDDFIVDECPATTRIHFEGDKAKRKKSTAELSEYEPCLTPDERFYKKPIDIDIHLFYCVPSKGRITFTLDEDFTLTKIMFPSNSNVNQNSIDIWVNDNEKKYPDYSNVLALLGDIGEIKFTEGDVITIHTDRLKKSINDGYLTLKGFNEHIILDKDSLNPETTNI